MSNAEEPWTIGRLLSWTVEYLTRQGAENPRLDAEVLLAEARGCRRIDLYAAYGEPAGDETRATFRELVRRRAAGTPVAYLVGRREFYALGFEVSPAVLIPRPETELLVVALLDEVKRRTAGGSADESADSGAARNSSESLGLRIADVGTGSGVLAVCAAKYVAGSRVTAIDISGAALAVARRNAERHGVSERIEFVESDLFANMSPQARFDYIVSNPPYVSTAEMAALARDVRDQEPHVALHAGERGLDVIEPLVQQSVDRIVPNGRLFIEVSPMIAAQVEQLVRDTAALQLVMTQRDLAGHPRVVVAERTRGDG